MDVVSPEDSPAEESVQVRRSGLFVEIAPPVPGIIETFLSPSHVFDAQDVRVVVAPRIMFWGQPGKCGQKPYLQGFAGLEPLLVDWLTRQGYHPELTGKRPEDLCVPDDECLEEAFDEIDRGMLEFVRHEDRGLIRFDAKHVRPSRLIAQIAKAWPKQRILVVVTRRQDAQQLRREIQNQLGVVALFAGSSPRRSTRVTVATPTYVHVGAIQVEKRTMVISCNPGELFSSSQLSPLEGLKEARRIRLFGLLPTATRLPPYLRSWVSALFGLREVVVPKHGFIPREINVAFVNIEGCPRSTSLTTWLRSGDPASGGIGYGIAASRILRSCSPRSGTQRPI